MDIAKSSALRAHRGVRAGSADIQARSTGMSREGRRPKPDGGDWGADPHGPDLPLRAAFSCRDGTQPTAIFPERVCYRGGGYRYGAGCAPVLEQYAMPSRKAERASAGGAAIKGMGALFRSRVPDRQPVLAAIS